jgi:sulfate adenylyltransferase
MKRALFVASGGRPGDAVLVNAVIGAERLGDFVDEAILRCVGSWRLFCREGHVVSFVLWDMRYGSPLESILHGVIRQNMGATHLMLGRGHADAISSTPTPSMCCGRRASRATALMGVLTRWRGT